ncbi:hypothetical protein BJV82DRAFT_584094 [Fennellomyces sp. T-0311]|nr:hypothetical protein BJV82DRAFT_584094 [Fennellomyces sp. T-0311]
MNNSPMNPANPTTAIDLNGPVQRILSQVSNQLVTLQQQVSDLQAIVSASAQQMVVLQEQIADLTRQQALTSSVVLLELPSAIELMRGYQQVSLGEEVVLAPLKPNSSAKKMVQPQDIKNFFATKCSPAVRANKDSVYLTMIHKVGVLGVELLHAKYSPIGGITEVDHFQRVMVENNLVLAPF